MGIMVGETVRCVKFYVLIKLAVARHGNQLPWFMLVFSQGRRVENTSIMFLATTSMIYDLFFTANHDFRSSSGNFSIEYRNMVLGI